jgi:hypothetical protein
MITAQLRRAVLGTFPTGTPFLVLAPDRSGFAEIVRERAEDVVQFCPLASEPPASTFPHLMLEGLDELADPSAFLQRVRATMPDARIFALVANAAHLVALGTLYAGRPIAAAHPLSFAEIAPLFAAAGWNPIAIKPLHDDALPAPEAAPVLITIAGLGVECVDATTLDRGRTAAYLVIADRA